ncbi:MAG: glycoside hydrolase family 88 protein [Chitinophagaceae bacterium]
MKKVFLVAACLLIASSIVRAQATKLPRAFIDKQLRLAASQYKVLMEQLPDPVFPRSYDAATRQLTTSNSSWWCSGFYPGTLLYLYSYTQDDVLKAEAIEKLALLEKEQFNTRTHDLGFMMYCSFGNAFRLWQDEKYKPVLLNSARSLATRFTPTTGVIRSWDFGDWKYPVIIDNMMNLELLTWSATQSNDSSLKQIAVAHANTTLKNHFRADYSSYHLVDYDPQTGQALKKQTVQGAADSSAWARGQGWALYGYTAMFRETGLPQYREQARHIARFILQHPRLPADKIPYWDFDAPGIPGALRDASSAAVIASALIELARYVSKKERKEFRSAAARMLRSLSSPVYHSQPGENAGFILKHSAGNVPVHSEMDAPLTYADYYYIEALLRYKDEFLQ